jgi:hypothetical protein
VRFLRVIFSKREALLKRAGAVPHEAEEVTAEGARLVVCCGL